MLGRGRGARAYQHEITLVKQTASEDWSGHAEMSAPVAVKTVYGAVSQMSASKTLMTFQQVEVVGLDIEFRNPGCEYNALLWRGHLVHFAQADDVDSRGRIVRLQGWYQKDAPEIEIQSGNGDTVGGTGGAV